jgi:hypothetical protein
MIHYGVSHEELEIQFFETLADVRDNCESVEAKIDLLLDHDTDRYPDNHSQDQM